jgi:hypothetical protein
MQVFSEIGNGEFFLEPHEAGWASEAIAIIYIREVKGASPSMRLRAQISADGQRWIDLGPKLGPLTEEGGYFLLIRDFGNWIRLAGEIDGGPDCSTALIADFYWSLKE